MLPVLFAFGPIVIHSFGIFLILTFFLSSFVFWKRAREEYYDEYDLIDLVFVAVFWGLVGGRIVFALLHFDVFGLNIFYWLGVWSRPGFVWFGILPAALLGVIRFCKVKKWNLYKTFDLSAIGISLAHALVNLGLFVGGSGIGRVTSLPVGLKFPGTFETRHPIGLYAFLLWMMVFGYLWWAEGRYRRFVWYQRSKGDARPGFLFFSYVIGLGIIGLMLGVLSEDEYVYLGVNIELLLRFVLVLIGLVGLYLRSGLSVSVEASEWWQWLRDVEWKKATKKWREK